MRRLWRSTGVRTALESFLIVGGAALCSPHGLMLILALQFASLPESWHSVVRFLMALTFFMPLVWLALAVLMPILTIASFKYRKYEQYHRLVPAFLIAWVISWASLPLRPSLAQSREPGLVKVALRAKPLISAIEAYRGENGEYPQRLSDLSPAFIEKAPYTGAVGYPNFEYSAATPNSLFKSYEVRVLTTSPFRFDRFVYWPEKNYPSRMYGGVIERVGDWAYVDE